MKIKYINLCADGCCGCGCGGTSTSGGTGGTGGTGSGGTGATSPNPPGGLSVSNITHQSALFSWTAPVDGTPAVSYKVYVNGVLCYNVSGLSQVINGLDPLTDYYLNVLSVDATGTESALSGSVDLSTLSAPVGTALQSVDMTTEIGAAMASRLIRRASYTGSFAAFDQYAALTMPEALNLLFAQQSHVQYAGAETGSLIRENWFDQQIGNTPTWYGKMSMFAFVMLPATIVGASNKDAKWWFELLLESVTRSYKDTIEAVSRDHNMGRRLNIADNIAGSPNENYGRELLELFTLSPGPSDGPGSYTHYSEADIVQAARVLTGFRNSNANRDMNAVTSYHDQGDKQFGPAFQDTIITGDPDPAVELAALVNMIFDQDRVAEYLMTRLYRFYLTDETDKAGVPIATSTAVIDEMAQIFKDNGFTFEPVLRSLFSSQHFHDLALTGHKYMSPMDLVLYCINYFDGESEVNKTVYLRTNGTGAFADLGMNFFDPPEIKGYLADYQETDLNKLWTDNSTSQNQGKYALDIMELNGPAIINALTNSPDVNVAIDTIYAYTNQDPIDDSIRDVLKLVMLEGSGDSHWTDGDAAERLQYCANLIQALAYSGEFKVY